MYTLGIDLGTTFTAAAVWRDGHAEIASLGSRTAAVPSVVLLREDASVLTGEAANRRAVAEPHRVAREFKRRLGDTTPILLAGTPFSAEALSARLLRSVVEQVTAAEGEAPSAVTICHPANWGAYKTDLLGQAVQLADLQVPVTYVTEPEAAAVFYATQQRLPVGAVVAVYDLGGGTFDAAVLRRTATGFEVLGRPEGIERLGGVDVDAAVVDHVLRALGGKVEELDEDDPAALAAVARLRAECVDAKEALSSDTDVSIPVILPNITTDVRLTRTELEGMVRPALLETIEALRRALRSADVTPEELHAVLLVGGMSRMPLVAQLVGAELGRPVAVDAHPKHAIALGASWLAAIASGASQLAAAAPAPAATPTAPAPATPAAGAAGAAAAAAAGAAGAAGTGSLARPLDDPSSWTRAQARDLAATAAVEIRADAARRARVADDAAPTVYTPPPAAPQESRSLPVLPPLPPVAEHRAPFVPQPPDGGGRGGRRGLLVAAVVAVVVLVAGGIAYAVSSSGGRGSSAATPSTTPAAATVSPSASASGSASASAPATSSPGATKAAAKGKITVTSLAGGGAVVVNPGNNRCETTCPLTYETPAPLTLKAVPGTDRVLLAWGGSCSGHNPTCTVQLADGNTKTVTAEFGAGLVLDLTINGTGSVQANPSGVTCSATCHKVFRPEQGVTLVPAPGTTVTWAGCPTERTGGACELPEGASIWAVTATFSTTAPGSTPTPSPSPSS